MVARRPRRAVVLIPSTTTSTWFFPLSLVLLHLFGGTRVRGHELALVRGRVGASLSDRWLRSSRFFYTGRVKPVRSRYEEIEYPSICSASTHQNRWSRQRQLPRGCSWVHTKRDKFHGQDAPGPQLVWRQSV